MTSILETEKHAYRIFVKHCFDSQPFEGSTKLTNTLEELLKSAFPISTQDSEYSLDYVCYDLRTYTPDGDEFMISQLSSDDFFYKNPDKHGGMSRELDAELDLLVTLNKIVWETPITNDPMIQDIMQQNVIFGPLPRMTVNGTFMDDGFEKRYVGDGLAVDHLADILGQALTSIKASVEKNFREINMEEALPCDLIETCHLEKMTRQFLDELLPVTLH